MSFVDRPSHRTLSRRRTLIAAALGAGMLGLALPQAHLLASPTGGFPGTHANGSAMLISHHLITPAGKQTRLWNLPMNAVFSPDGSHMLVANSGARSEERLQVVATSTSKVVQTLSYDAPDGVVFGLAYSPDGKHAYASGGGKDEIHTYVVDNNNKLIPSGDIAVGPGDGSAFPLGMATGLANTPAAGYLAVANDIANTVSVIDTSSQLVQGTIPVGHYPYTVAISPSGATAYVSNWEDGTLSVISTAAFAKGVTAGNGKVVSVPSAVTGTIRVGNHPTAMVFSRSGGLLYVANANSDSISVVNTASNVVVNTISLAPYAGAPLSSTPVSLALNATGRTLFVALAGENALAVVDTLTNRVAGRIPTAWYPSTVLLSAKNASLYVTNAKGTGGGPNDVPGFDPNPTRTTGPFAYDGYCNCAESQYTGSYIMGTLSTIPVPSPAALLGYTAQVAINNHVGDPALLRRSPGNPLPVPGGISKFKHVIYINKENRTFDQVFGDITGAGVNSDPSLVLFGQSVTPNEHALIRRFGVLDNFYADAEVSADGHNWINGAYASDYNEKMWPQDYSQGAGRNRGYDFEGDTKVNLNPGGYLWDAAAKAHVTYRDYGDFYAFASSSYLRKNSKVISAGQAASCPGPVAHSYIVSGKPLPIPAGAVLCMPAERANPITTPNLVGHIDPRYRSFDVGYREADRLAEWKREFAAFVQNGNLPALELLRLPNDHTEGTAPGWLTPQAYVAENDAAVGAVVDAVSHSPYWKDTLIIVTEDDAQNGPDHIDGHRTTSLIISAYNQYSTLTVDHTLYDTAAMVRTAELAIGLSPMSQYDAQATPMWRLFKSTPDLAPYTARPESITPSTVNHAHTYGAAISAKLNFTQEDRAPAGTVNSILWHSIKGANTAYPTSHYTRLNGDN